MLGLVAVHSSSIAIDHLSFIEHPGKLRKRNGVHLFIILGSIINIGTIFYSLQQVYPTIVVIDQCRHLRHRSACGNGLDDNRLGDFYRLMIIYGLLSISCNSHITADFINCRLIHIGQFFHPIEDAGTRCRRLDIQ